jgi:hypothetical protein
MIYREGAKDAKKMGNCCWVFLGALCDLWGEWSAPWDTRAEVTEAETADDMVRLRSPRIGGFLWGGRGGVQ